MVYLPFVCWLKFLQLYTCFKLVPIFKIRDYFNGMKYVLFSSILHFLEQHRWCINIWRGITDNVAFLGNELKFVRNSLNNGFNNTCISFFPFEIHKIASVDCPCICRHLYVFLRSFTVFSMCGTKWFHI